MLMKTRVPEFFFLLAPQLFEAEVATIKNLHRATDTDISHVMALFYGTLAL